jgi:hypothetical protein
MVLVEKKVIELQIQLQKREVQLKNAKEEVGLLPCLKVDAAGVERLTNELETANKRIYEMHVQLQRVQSQPREPSTPQVCPSSHPLCAD